MDKNTPEPEGLALQQPRATPWEKLKVIDAVCKTARTFHQASCSLTGCNIITDIIPRALPWAVAVRALQARECSYPKFALVYIDIASWFKSHPEAIELARKVIQRHHLSH